MTDTQLQRGIYRIPIDDPCADASIQPFWSAASEGRLTAAKCKHCGTFQLPPAPCCFVCQRDSYVWVHLPGSGTIYTFTVIRHPLWPDLREAVPYVSAVIDLDGTQGAGARLAANVVNCDPDEVRIGDRVRVVFERISGMLTVPRFVPDEVR